MVNGEHKGKILYRRLEKDPIRTLMLRSLFILLLLVVLIIIFWVHRADLSDQQGGTISIFDVIYFTFITITTVGYGDIVPVTETARIIDAVIVTPIRVIIWLTFIGTAYEFIIPKYMEGYRLKELKRKLSGHFIIVGYGSTGKAVAEELVHTGTEKDRIIILDKEADRTEEASMDGYLALRGDATREEMLTRAVVRKAGHIIVVTGKDDTNVLVVLTARHMNNDLKIVVRANMEENRKLLRRSGADVVIAPLVAGGKLMAASTLWETAARVLQDILTSKHGLRVLERRVEEAENGKRPKDLPGIVVLAVQRGREILDPPELDEVELGAGDKIIYLEATDESFQWPEREEMAEE